jgi:hypothetical protein
VTVQIYIEGQRLDLFEEDNITIQSVVKDIDDLSLKTDFSQSFNVPASSNNNNIFKRYYDFNVDNGFDARTRKLATIDIDTIDFKRGKISLDRVKIKNGQPESYQLTFFGEAIKVKDLIGDDELSSLDWLDNFNHNYTDANVQTGLTTGLDFTVDGTLYNKAVIYPLVSYTKQYFYNSDPSDTTATDSLTNIAYDPGRTQGVDYTDLKPAINLSVIIKAIQEKYGFTFTGNFFDTEQYKQIYVNLNKTRGTLANGVLTYESLSGNVVNFQGGLGELPQSDDNLVYRTTITPDDNTIGYKVRLTLNDSVIYESNNLFYGANTFFGDVQEIPDTYNVTATVLTESDFTFDAYTRLIIDYEGGIPDVLQFENNYINQSITLTTTITNEFPEIKTFDFLQSIIKVFNLIVTTNQDGTLYFNDLQSWYSEGHIYDITPYVETKEKTVNKGKVFNQLDFLFEESNQILADFYKQENKRGYGDIEQKLLDTDGNLLDGDPFEVNLIFENPIFERLYDLNDNGITTLQYGLILDDDLSPYVGEPFMFYAPLVNISPNTIGFNTATTYSELSGNVLMPSHSMQIDVPSFNLNFNAEINEYTSQVFSDTIYKRYYDDFITDIFSVKRRSIQLEAILPINLLHRLRMNDRVIIQDTRYIINKIDSNIVNRLDRLELVNDIYEAPLASDSLNTSVFRTTSQRFNAGSHFFTANYIGLDNQTASKVDLGYGVTWVTLTNPKTVGASSEITFTIDENNTGLKRSMRIQVNDGLKNPSFTITQLTAQQGALNFRSSNNSAFMSTILTTKT